MTDINKRIDLLLEDAIAKDIKMRLAKWEGYVRMIDSYDGQGRS